MKKYFVLFVSLAILFAFAEASQAQVKPKKKVKIEKKKRGKPLGEDGKVARPDKPGKPLGKDGQVARPDGLKGSPKVNKGSASLVFFYFGDEPTVTLAQETMELYRAMKDYDKVVLLKHELVDGKYVVSQRALNKADVVDLPTNENINKYLGELTREGYYIDVWIFSHGSYDKWFRTSTGTDGSEGKFRESDIKNLPENTGFEYLPIRMVYQVNCHAYHLISAWREIGAKTALGARSVNFYPYEFARFATQWNKGNKTFKEARDKADETTPRSPTNIYIRDIDAPQQKRDGKWSGCKAGYNVLGTTEEALECGEEYFTTCWSHLEWKDNGKTTMLHSSWKIVAGDYDLTKKTKPEW